MTSAYRPKHAPLRDLWLSHLTQGPLSHRLEFTNDFFVEELAVGQRTRSFLLDQPEPDAIRFLAESKAKNVGLTLLHPPVEKVFSAEDEQIERLFEQAAAFAIDVFLAAGRPHGEQLEQLVAALPTDGNERVPAEGLRETGRLAIQCYRVYDALVTFGTLPGETAEPLS